MGEEPKADQNSGVLITYWWQAAGWGVLENV
jgi:hypothetical protein